MANIQAAIFDMDGLMLDTERMSRDAWVHAMAHHGYSLSDETYIALVGRTTRDGEQILKKAYGDDFPHDPINDLHKVFFRRMIYAGGIPMKAGLVDLLDWLDARGIAKAVATSTFRDLATVKLQSTGLAERFSVVVTGDEVKQGKPAPDIFLRAAELLGVAPEDSVVLEDSEAGAQAALAAGMKLILVPDLKTPAPEIRKQANAVLTSLAEAAAVIEKL